MLIDSVCDSIVYKVIGVVMFYSLRQQLLLRQVVSVIDRGQWLPLSLNNPNRSFVSLRTHPN